MSSLRFKMKPWLNLIISYFKSIKKLLEVSLKNTRVRSVRTAGLVHEVTGVGPLWGCWPKCIILLSVPAQCQRCFDFWIGVLPRNYPSADLMAHHTLHISWCHSRSSAADNRRLRRGGSLPLKGNGKFIFCLSSEAQRQTHISGLCALNMYTHMATGVGVENPRGMWDRKETGR